MACGSLAHIPAFHVDITGEKKQASSELKAYAMAIIL